jgi:hypothetical protein
MAPDHSGPSDAETPLAFNCPKCGLPLRPHAYRTEITADGHPEQIYVYLCFEKDGFFTFSKSRGLTQGL